MMGVSVEQPAAPTRPPRILVIPGLDGATTLMAAAAPVLFQGMRPLLFDHSLDRAEGGVEALADRALRVLDQDEEGDSPALVCGESFGGTVALTLSRRHPDRVSGLILLSAFGWYPSLATWSGHLGLLLWRIVGNRIANCILRASRPLGVPGALGFRFSREIARVYVGQCHLDLAAYRAKCELSLRFDARPWLGSITCPTFVLVGSWDPIVPTSAGRALARSIPNARLYQLPGGHVVHAVRAVEAGQLIAAWLAETLEGHHYSPQGTRPAALKRAARFAPVTAALSKS
jgi:pimeloyl-ACP methyl ester carboxylesterase